jgi:hypothetical protein
MGPEGLEPSPTWLRARRSAARALVPSGVSPIRVGPEGVEPSSSGYQPNALPLSYGPIQESHESDQHQLGPEGLEPPPPGLKGRHAAVTPRPRGSPLQGQRFSRIFISSSSNRDGRIRTGALLLPRQADCQAFPRPGSEPHTLDPTLVMRSGRPDSNRRSQAPRACGLPGFPTPCRIAREGVEPSSPP